MKSIFFYSTLIGENDILYGLLDIGIETVIADITVDLDDISDEQIGKITGAIEGFDFAITRNFSVNVAEACHIKGIPYVAWCYDSPVRALYSAQALYDTNCIFLFDKRQLDRMKKHGISNVYHQPLAANMFKASGVSVTEEDLITYGRDVSFVGGLYARGFYETIIGGTGEECRYECEKLFD